MSGGKSEESALETARVRFVASLPRKSVELGTAIEALWGSPSQAALALELRRRLHAMYASALVFRMVALCAALEQAIATVDRAIEQRAALSEEELEQLTRNLAGLEARVDGENAPEPALDDEPSQIMRAPLRGLTTASVQAKPPKSPKPSATTLHFIAPIRLPDEEGAPASTAPAGVASAGVASAGVASAGVASAGVASTGAGEPSQAGTRESPLLTRTLRVVLLARRERASIQRALDAVHLQIEVVSDADALLACVREDAPDVVLADAELAHAGHLAAQLRGDPLTDYLPIVLFRAPAQSTLALDTLRSHVDAVVTTPLDSAELTRVLGRVTGTLLPESAGVAAEAARDITVEELASRVAESVRRGILDAAEGAHGFAMNVHDDSQVRAAALTAVASVRSFVEERSLGKVRFESRGGAAQPGLLQLSGAMRDDVDTSVLAGRRVLLADDDTGVLVLLSGLLRAQGATVVEVTDGEEALASARNERPDLILADVVMPGRDGLSLCRELAGDPLLADVPVLLVSAREELLLCARESAPGSPAAVRRDQLGRRVLAQAAVTLAPRVALERELRNGGEVRGSIESIGVVALLRSVRRQRPDARICLRDAWNAFEVILSDGRVARLTRTASDGSFVRDEQVLPQLVAISRGRFSVETAPPSAKIALFGTLDEVLTRAADELAAQREVVRLPALNAVARVVFDEDAVASLLRHGHAALGRVVSELHRGTPVAELEKSARVSLPLVESLLVDLTHRGAIRLVEDASGADLVERARVARQQRVQGTVGSPLSRIPPPPDPVISLLPPAPVAAVAALEVSAAAAVESDSRPAVVREEAANSNPEHPPAAVDRTESARPAAALPTLPPSAAPRRHTGMAGWAVALVALMALGFLLGRWREVRSHNALTALAPASAPIVAPGAPDVPVHAPNSASVAPVPAVEPLLIAPEEVGFSITRGVPSEINVSAGQGVVAVDALAGFETATLSVDDRPLGPIPARIALAEGIHELAIQHGDAVTYRFVSVRPGQTYTLTAL